MMRHRTVLDLEPTILEIRRAEGEQHGRTEILGLGRCLQYSTVQYSIVRWRDVFIVLDCVGKVLVCGVQCIGGVQLVHILLLYFCCIYSTVQLQDSIHLPLLTSHLHPSIYLLILMGSSFKSF